MASKHELTCPHCGASLLLEWTDSNGGVVENTLTLLEHTPPKKGAKEKEGASA